MDIGLIFGMVFAIILIGLLIVFGYQQIMEMQRLQDMAQKKKALDSLRTAVDRVYSLSGETSESFTLSFPNSIRKICFMPSYRGHTESAKEGRLRSDLVRVIDATWQEKQRLAALLTEMRITNKPGSTYQKIDNNQTVLLFSHSEIVPEWQQVPHLEPSAAAGYITDVICTGPQEKIWLQRRFDRSGAWVDIVEA